MKKLSRLIALSCMIAVMTTPASALKFSIDAPGGPAYSKATSVETVYTADNGARKNEDISKNAALAPPSFGSPSIDALCTGRPLTPNLAPGYMLDSGAVISGSTGIIATPPDMSGAVYLPDASTVTVTTPATSTVTPIISTGHTDVTADLFYSSGSLGTLKIPAIGLTVKIVQGTDSKALAKGAGHFEDTSIWDGNCCFAAHNRGTNSYFGKIHTLQPGDTISLTTKLGTRTYAVSSVNKIGETDSSLLAPTTDNCITLFTCVRDQRDYRWAIRAVEIV